MGHPIASCLHDVFSALNMRKPEVIVAGVQPWARVTTLAPLALEWPA